MTPTQIKPITPETMPMNDRRVLITGASSGIGRQAAVQLAALGADLALTGRNQQRLDETARMAQDQPGCGEVRTLSADLSRQAQVHHLADWICTQWNRLDVLINNAGGVFMRNQRTDDGVEMSWAVNHMAPFILTYRMLPLLKAAPAGRVINLSSIAHYFATPGFGHIRGAGLHIPWSVYAQTKLAEVFFTRELARRLAGSNVTANAVHPGLVRTSIGKRQGWFLRAIFGVVDLFSVGEMQGGEALTRLAADPDLKGVNGVYFDIERQRNPSWVGQSRALAEKLWRVSAEITQIPENW